MSRTRRIAAVAMLACIAGGAVGAQSVARQQAVLDSIVVVQRQASGRRKAWDDSAATARAAMDTLAIGAFRLIVEPGNDELASAAARMAMDTLQPLGEELLGMVRARRMVVRRAPVPRWSARRIQPVVVAQIDAAGAEARPMWTQTGNARDVGNYLIEQARGIIAARVDSPFARWLGGHGDVPPIRFDTVRAESWTQLRLDLVSSPSLAARGCYEGDLHDCRIVLGLDSSSAPARELFDARGRRRVVESNAPSLRRRDFTTTEACLRGTDASCVQLLERSGIDLPLGAVGHRIALVQLAIQLGGPDAPARALRGGDTPAQRVERISGLPADSVVRLWQSRVRTVRIPSDNMTAGMAFASVGWIALLVLFASRSRRWR